MKKIFFVHDWFINIGGAEKVFFDLLEKHSLEATKIYTLFSTKKFFIVDGKKIKVITALPNWILNIFVFFQNRKFFLLSSVFDYRNLMFFFPLLVKILSNKINKDSPNTVVISSFATVKNINVNCKKILYLHSPMQYIRENYSENIKKLSRPISTIYKYTAYKLRKRDKKEKTFDQIYYNSFYTKSIAEKIYGWEKGEVVYPKISKSFLLTDIGDVGNKSYYLFIGRLVRFVRELDKIIELFNQTKKPLLIMGTGPDELYLKKKAGDSIIFLGHVSDENEKINILKNSLGLINITKESFGIATCEALSLGVPIFGFNEGGTKELVDDISGVLVKSKDKKTLIKGFLEFEQKTFDRKKIKENFIKKYSSFGIFWENKSKEKFV